MSASRKCDEKFATESKKLSLLMRLDATDGQITSSDSEDEPLDNPVVSQIIASCRKNRMSNVWEREADLLYAFYRDPELCAKVVCALYRQNLKVRNGSLSIIGSGGFRSSEFDVLRWFLRGQSYALLAQFSRMTALAKFLVDGDPENRMKKSASDLKQCDPKGHEDVQRIAKAYSKQFQYISHHPVFVDSRYWSFIGVSVVLCFLFDGRGDDDGAFGFLMVDKDVQSDERVGMSIVSEAAWATSACTVRSLVLKFIQVMRRDNGLVQEAWSSFYRYN
ncbi:hypothetical protein AKJ16_DCAP00687 [Drosera capensis]